MANLDVYRCPCCKKKLKPEIGGNFAEVQCTCVFTLCANNETELITLLDKICARGGSKCLD